MTWTAEAQRLQSEVQNTDAEIQSQQDRLQQEELTAQQRQDIQNDLNRLSTLRSQLQDQYTFFAGRDARIQANTERLEEQRIENRKLDELKKNASSEVYLEALRKRAASAGSGSPADIAYLKEREAQGKAFESYTPIAYTGTYSSPEEMQTATYEEGGKTVLLYKIPAEKTTYNPGFLSQVGVTPQEPRPDLVEAQNKARAEQYAIESKQFQQDTKDFSLWNAEQHKESLFAKQQTKQSQQVWSSTISTELRPTAAGRETMNVSPPEILYGRKMPSNEVRAAEKPKGIINKLTDYSERLQYAAQMTSSPLDRQVKMYGAAAISFPVGVYGFFHDITHPVKTTEGIIYSATHPFEAGAQLKEQIDFNPAGFVGETAGYLGAANLLTMGASKLKSKVAKVEVSGSQLETRRITNPETGKVIDIAQQDTQVIVGKNKYSFSGVAAEVYSPTTKKNLFTSKGRLELVQNEGNSVITKVTTIEKTTYTVKFSESFNNVLNKAKTAKLQAELDVSYAARQAQIGAKNIAYTVEKLSPLQIEKSTKKITKISKITEEKIPGGPIVTKGKTVGLVSVSENVASAERLSDITIKAGGKSINKKLLSASKQVLEGKTTRDVSMVLKAEKNKPLSAATPESISAGKTFEIFDSQTPSGLRYQIFEGASLRTTEKSFVEALSNKEIPDIRKTALNRVIESGGKSGSTQTVQKLKSATQIQDFKQLTETVTRENIQATTSAKLKPIADSSILLKTGIIVEPIIDFKMRTAPATVVKTNIKKESLLEPPVQIVKQGQKISRRIETRIEVTSASKESTSERSKSDVLPKSRMSEITMQETGMKDIVVQKEIQATAQETATKQKVLSGLKWRSVMNSPVITQTPFQTTMWPSARPSVQERSRGGIFSLFIRRRGQFFQEGTMPSLNEAVEMGIRKVQHSAAASFRIEGAPQAEINQAAMGILPQSFGRSKREPGVFIQKRGFRIGTQEEKAEITFKGIQTIRSKKKKSIFGKISLGG